MLKTNTKKARDNIRAYIVNNTINEDGDTFPDFSAARDYIMTAYREEMSGDYRVRRAPYMINSYGLFRGWASGLPSGMPFDYFYRPAVPVLGDILEESEEERARYTERQAEELFSRLIFRELTR